jgi:hypothetical protein
VAVVVLIVVIAAGAYIGYSGIQNQPSATPTPTPSPEENTRLEAADTALMFIQSNHTETASLPSSVTWTGGRQDQGGLVGSELYIYTGNGWNMTIRNPVIPDPTYTVNATYTANGAVTLDWSGTYFHGEINETTYCYNP